MKKKHIVAIIVAFVIVIDLCVALYPTVSARINSQRQSRVVARYFEDLSVMDEGQAQALLEAARAYNETLRQKTNRFQFSQAETARYEALLNTGLGVMGVLVVDKIGVKLPVYHGTGEGVLQIGLGHMPGTSLPVGGAGTHAFLTGHSGLPSATLLSDLNKLARGDTFVLHVMGETLTYRVDKIQTVAPHVVGALDIDPAMDYCTLVTCTPYGINTHRLLVRGVRTENAVSGERAIMRADAQPLEKPAAILLFVAPLLPVLMIIAIVRCRKIRKGGSR